MLTVRTKNFALTLEDSSYGVGAGLLGELEGLFLRGTPFVYLLGQSEFYGRRFFITSDVLIPRPETEQLVELIAKESKKFQTMVDVGTGSGAILLTLLDLGIAQQGLGIDCSKEALEVACNNSRRLRLEDRCELLLGDRLKGVGGRFDLIVSNPPYIKATTHKHLVHSKVDEFEPRMALYLEDSTYQAWFEEFFGQVLLRLSENGLFMMEGHEHELTSQAAGLKELGFKNVQVLKDFAGRDRFLKAMI
ncbi:MAG TPA: HemK/PrmC family methyltransferase [Bacteriovoracaceae bacterium]|nr:HemK/PrmC family methyltransferase [Bacteriovoracaceae bacterium]